MKRLVLVFSAAVVVVGGIVPTTAAQSDNSGESPSPIVIPPVEPEVSPPVSDLPPSPPSGDVKVPERIVTPQGPVAEGGGPDPLAQLTPAARAGGITLSAPLVKWNGMSGSAPNDTVGDVGPNHFVQMVQESVQIWTKDGTSVAGPFPFSNLWNDGVVDEACEFSAGDPIVLYDNLADRWLLSTFQPDAPNPFANFLCIAISQTPDPTGAYHLYQFDVGEFPDYFKIGAWTDGYYMSFNGGADAPAWVFNRANMLAGNPAGALRLGSVPNLAGVGFDVLMPADIDGATPPPAGTPGYFYRQVNGEVSGGVDRVDLYTGTVDWSTMPPTGALSAPISIPLAAFDGALCGYGSFGCAPQPGTALVLDPVNEIPMFRFPYRNYGNREVLAGNFTVDVNGADGHGVRWFVLQRTGGGAWTVSDEGTFATQPPGAPAFVHRFMGSVAMDRNGNLALAHTATSSAAVFPSARYAGRTAGDPPGVFSAPEQTMQAGADFVTGGVAGTARWGDYYALTVDPVDDCTFWYTGDYGAAVNLRQSVVGSFRFSNCGLDYGDAPDPTYPTLLANNGARHTAGALFLGAAVDAEGNGLPNATATGDDIAGIPDDEDGVTFSAPITAGAGATVDVTASGGGLLNAWVDFNADGDWADPGEQIFTNQALVAGANAGLAYTVPAGATPGATFARFRVSSAGGLAPTGAAADGEVEDYQVTIAAAPPPPPPPPPPPHDVGLVTGDNWQLRDHKTGAVRTITFGVAGDYPIMGDWDCNGTETPGLFRQTKPPGEPNLPEGLAYYRNDNAPGVQIGQFRFVLGNPGDIPLAGDFNGDGCDSLSVYRPSEQRFYIADKLPPPIPLNQPLQPFNANKSYIFGNAGDKPFVGDFNGDGIETIGLHRESTGLVYYLNSHPTGSPPADVQYVFGDPGDRLVAGDWVIVDRKFSPALFRSSNATFYFRDDNAVSFKPAAASFPFSIPGSAGIPVSGVMGL